VDSIVADAWSLLGVIWRILLIAAPLALIAWAILKGRRVDSRALENGKLDAATRADPVVDVVGRNIPPPSF
jgi:hypothetical protein